ncbi:MAG: ATP-binding domain-containing protein [Polaromonas sp.]|nr:ATP-binding domain-containing protein [Polaromonas sp.]
MGPDVAWVDAPAPIEQANAIVARIAQWLSRDDSNQATLRYWWPNPKSYAYELLSEAMKNSAVKFVFADHSAVGGVLVDTVSRFKGLESQAVVLWVGDEVVDEERKETMYVGVTRAKSLLAVVGSNRVLKKLRA